MNIEKEHRRTTIPDTLTGMRFDRALARMFPDYSRARLQTWIRNGQITVDGQCIRGRDRTRGGERVRLVAQLEENDTWEAQALPLCVIYEDEEIFVIDKPAGLVVHPGAGNPQGTLVNALLHRDPHLAGVPRAGVVHRLDKDTTGLLVIARTLRAHNRLVILLKERDVVREYDAVTVGALLSGGTVNAPVGRHAIHRTRMAVTDRGRSAVTHYRVRHRFPAHTHIRVNLETGRTHQIRVHMAYIGHPLVGDPIYGARPFVPKGADAPLRSVLRRFDHQALHAGRLSFAHPVSGEPCSFECPLPNDFTELLGALKGTAGSHAQIGNDSYAAARNS
ncbi:MAG: ribosomal large subunit pseudouridine synthase D [Candidatus Kentron sp. G]|nr:MAG: ribosomal large subunit pseudouridine synthase D [Candidatus Kentron sp. G]VFN06471.1 MAG: ribosomal large subunit pseudouridine synthase D [Candidatus Kentron sp. G]VFN07111.1 MAG: ribosomal large subunit pseudouridine synthase D [Candidatus Kentron sp. G]